MDCGNCGARNPRGNQFCVKCGARLAPASAGPADSRPAPDPARAQELLDQAFRYSDQGLLDEAIEACRNATIANPSSTSAHSFLGILYERAGEREKAIREYELALSLSPESVAERESLEQLVSETGAPAGLPKISRRLARNALIAGFAVVAVILSAAILFTYNRGREARATLEAHYPYSAAKPGPPPPTVESETPDAAPATPPAGGSYADVHSPLQTGEPAYRLPAPQSEPLPEPKPPRLVVPTTGVVVEWSPPAALADTTRTRVEAPSTRASAGPGERVVASPQAARDYYFGREYDAAIGVYERMLRLRPGGDAAIREELAWTYYQADRRSEAVSQYQQALDAYQRQLERGVEPEQAQLGMRTCRAAIEALSAHKSR